jgi:hypothetical protein
MYPKTMKVLSKVTDSHDAQICMQIEEASPNQMRRYGIYLSIVTKGGEIIGVLVSLSTAEDEGTTARSGDYEKVKLHEQLTSKDLKSEHLKHALHPANDWHVIPLVLMNPSEISTPENDCPGRLVQRSDQLTAPRTVEDALS